MQGARGTHLRGLRGGAGAGGRGGSGIDYSGAFTFATVLMGAMKCFYWQVDGPRAN